MWGWGLGCLGVVTVFRVVFEWLTNHVSDFLCFVLSVVLAVPLSIGVLWTHTRWDGLLCVAAGVVLAYPVTVVMFYSSAFVGLLVAKIFRPDDYRYP